MEILKSPENHFLILSMHILPDNTMNKNTTKSLLLLDNPNYVFNYL
jgi:hypothetical protein